MATLAETFIRVRGDVSIRKDVDQDLKKIDGKSAGKRVGSEVSKGFNTSFKDVAKTVAVGAGIAAIGIWKTVQAASDLNESVSKTKVVFGDSAKAVFGFANASATGMGLSRQKALEAASTFGNLFVSMKLGQKPAADMSTKMVKLAGDLASFNNVSPEEALEALRSGLTGETEPLRRFGVNLNEAAIKAEALRLGLVKGAVDMVKVKSARAALMVAQENLNKVMKDGNATSAERAAAQARVTKAEDALKKAMGGSVPELTAAQKAQAAYSLILDQTKTAQGDFARTSSGLANQQRILKAQFEDVKAKVGEALLPIFLKVGNWLTKTGIPGFVAFINTLRDGEASSSGFAGVMERIALVIRSVAGGIGGFIGWMREGSVAARVLTTVLGVLIGWITAVVVAQKLWTFALKVHVAIMRLWHTVTIAGTVAVKVWHGLMRVAAVATRLWAAAQWLLNAAMRANPIGIVVTVLTLLVAGIVIAYKRSETFRNVVQGAWNGIKTAVSAVWNGFLKPVFASFVAFLKTLGQWAMWLWRNVIIPAWNGIRAVVSVAVNLVIGYIKLWIAIIRGVASVLSWLWRNVVTPVWNGIRAAISVVIAVVRKSIEGWITVLRTLGGWFNWLWRNIIIPVWNGIKNVISTVWNNGIWPVFRSIRDVITKTIPNAFRQGRDAITNAWTAVRNTISTTWNKYIWPIFRTVRDVITKTIPNAFRTGVDTISKWWYNLQALVRDPIKWVIAYVINRGIIDNLNRVRKWLHLPGKDIGWVPNIGSPPARSSPNRGSSSTAGLARGGVIPGYEPGRDTVPAMLSKGEGVMVPQFVKAVGKKTIYRWNALARKGALRGFAKGGVIGERPIGGPLEDFTNLTKVFTDPLKWLKNLVPFKGITDRLGDSPLGNIAKGAGEWVLSKGVEKLKSWLAFWEGFGGGTYLGRDPTRSISTILAVAKRFYSGARVSSGYRPGENSWHGRGLAADLIGGGASGMAKIARGFYGMSGRLLELIHSGGGGFFVKNGKRVSSSYYRSIIGQHYNHVHVAARRDALTRTVLGGFVGSGKLASWISAAMAITHTSPSWFAALVALAKHESGGNPKAINLWDSNAKAGHPSKGLFQTIDSTFNKYKLPGMGDIWNPIHNAVAAIRYIKARYGTIFNIPSYRPGNRFVGGYESGGIVPQTGFAKVHKGEEVTSLPDRIRQISIWEAILDRMERLIDATEGIGPAVGAELVGGVSSARTLARGRVRPR